MKAPSGVDIATVIRIECMTQAKEIHKLEWGLRWEKSIRRGVTREGWIVSQRYARAHAMGIELYPWIDILDVLVGGREFGRAFVMPWLYARADRVVYLDQCEGLLQPWQYTVGANRAERSEGAGRREFQVIVDDDGSEGTVVL